MKQQMKGGDSGYGYNQLTIHQKLNYKHWYLGDSTKEGGYKRDMEEVIKICPQINTSFFLCCSEESL